MYELEGMRRSKNCLVKGCISFGSVCTSLYRSFFFNVSRELVSCPAAAVHLVHRHWSCEHTAKLACMHNIWAVCKGGGKRPPLLDIPLSNRETGGYPYQSNRRSTPGEREANQTAHVRVSGRSVLRSSNVPFRADLTVGDNMDFWKTIVHIRRGTEVVNGMHSNQLRHALPSGRASSNLVHVVSFCPKCAPTVFADFLRYLCGRRSDQSPNRLTTVERVSVFTTELSTCVFSRLWSCRLCILQR
jgi:hypothetical protein